MFFLTMTNETRKIKFEKFPKPFCFLVHYYSLSSTRLRFSRFEISRQNDKNHNNFLILITVCLSFLIITSNKQLPETKQNKKIQIRIE